jgi:hypothetical protein
MTPKQSNDHGTPPGKRALETALGRTSAHWSALHAGLSAEYSPLGEKWSFSAKTGRWSLQLKQGRTKRTILYMIVCEGHFLAGFALGEQACRAARESGLPPAVLELIEQAPRYAEGRGVWLEVRTRKDVANVLRLAAVKLAN